MLGLEAACCQLHEYKTFQKLCDSLPKEEADRLRTERAVRINSDIEHRKALEIAEAGRARNFWGQ